MKYLMFASALALMACTSEQPYSQAVESNKQIQTDDVSLESKETEQPITDQSIKDRPEWLMAYNICESERLDTTPPEVCGTEADIAAKKALVSTEIDEEL